MRIEAKSKLIALDDSSVSIEVLVKHVTALGGSEKSFTFGPFVSAQNKLVKSCVRKAISDFLK